MCKCQKERSLDWQVFKMGTITWVQILNEESRNLGLHTLKKRVITNAWRLGVVEHTFGTSVRRQRRVMKADLGESKSNLVYNKELQRGRDCTVRPCLKTTRKFLEISKQSLDKQEERSD